ncbi:MAG: DUF4347 domain-containing protein [Cyanobacteria bacterium J06631_2]
MNSLSRKFAEYVQSSDYQARKAIVFIDSRVDRCDSLVQQATSEVRVFVLGWLADGISAVTETLNSSSCREVYLVCPGAPGCLYLGRSELSFNTLIQHESDIKSWFQPSVADSIADSAEPQLHLYGSNVASGDVGTEFMGKLKSMTGAEIAASNNVYRGSIFN